MNFSWRSTSSSNSCSLDSQNLENMLKLLTDDRIPIRHSNMCFSILFCLANDVYEQLQKYMKEVNAPPHLFNNWDKLITGCHVFDFQEQRLM